MSPHVLLVTVSASYCLIVLKAECLGLTYLVISPVLLQASIISNRYRFLFQCSFSFCILCIFLISALFSISTLTLMLVKVVSYRFMSLDRSKRKGYPYKMDEKAIRHGFYDHSVILVLRLERRWHCVKLVLQELHYLSIRYQKDLKIGLCA